MESYYLYFLTYSFLGWCMETTLFSVKEKRFVNRGFLNGPLCPVYGFGMVIIIYLLEPFYNNIPMLFILGMILASLLEYITGYLLEKLFYTRWWDYSKKRFNINGYICLENSLAWGALCILMIHNIQPHVEKFINNFSNIYLHSFVVVSFIILVIDAIFTIIHLINLKTLIKNIEELKQQVNNKLAESPKLRELHNKLAEDKIYINNYVEEIIKNHGELINNISLRNKLKERIKNRPVQVSRLLDNYNLETLKNKHNETAKQIRRNFSKK